MNFDAVRRIALALPDVEESATFGAASFKLNGSLLTCPALNSSAEADSLMVRIGLDLRAELLAAHPDIYYLTPHYEPYPCVLVRLKRIRSAMLRKLLGTAWVFVSSKSAGSFKAPANQDPRERRRARRNARSPLGDAATVDER